MVCIRTGLPERRERYIHNVWPHGFDRIESHAGCVSNSRTGILEDEVGGCSQRQKVRLARCILEIKHNTALTPVVGLKRQARGRCVARQWRQQTRPAATWRFDLDDVGTHTSKHERGELCSTVSQVENSIGRK